MPVTRDPDFPAEIAALVQAFNQCCEGHNTLHVLEASTNFLIAAIGAHAHAAGKTRADAVEIANYIGGNLPVLVRRQWDREPQPTDVVVPMGGH